MRGTFHSGDLRDLRPGDCLLYGPVDFFGQVTAIKTWCRKAVHVEIYLGKGISAAARRSGVDRYPLRTDGLTAVRRPNIWLRNQPRLSSEWFDAVAHGQKYDTLGLLCFFLAVKRGSRDRMFCSEFGTRQYRHWDFEPFNPKIDADTVAPSMYWQAGTLTTIWSGRT